jgi:hypothetical protein
MIAKAKQSARIIVRDRTAATRLLRMLARGVPAGLLALWRGPVTAMRLEDAGQRHSRGWSPRPVEVVVGLDLVLKSRFSLPREARQDLH